MIYIWNDEKTDWDEFSAEDTEALQKHGCFIGKNARVGRRVSIHPPLHIGDNAAIMTGVSLGADVTIGDSALIESGASIHGWAIIGKGACVGFGACVWRGVKIGDGARVGPESFIGDGAVILENARIPFGTVIGESAWVQSVLFSVNAYLGGNRITYWGENKASIGGRALKIDDWLGEPGKPAAAEQQISMADLAECRRLLKLIKGIRERMNKRRARLGGVQ